MSQKRERLQREKEDERKKADEKMLLMAIELVNKFII